MLPTLGGYIWEVASFALCCSSLLIAAPVWILFLSMWFCALFVYCYIWSLTLFWFLFLFSWDLVDIELDSRAINAAYKYRNGWSRWRTRVQSMLGVPVFLAVPLQVALYLTELVERAVLEGHSVSAIESASCSIWCGHRLAGIDSPTIYPLVKGVVEGARRSQAAVEACLYCWLP